MSTTVPPARNGQPYTDEELERMVAMTRDGRTAEDLAAATERRTTGIVQRLRRMLPLEYRSCPPDRVVPALREVLADSTYDWRRAMLLSPPPRPVIKPADVVRSGVAGLDDRELVTIAYLLIASGRPRDVELLRIVGREVRRRWLIPELVELRTRRIIHEGICIPRELSLREAAELWVFQSDGWAAGQHVPLKPDEEMSDCEPAVGNDVYPVRSTTVFGGGSHPLSR